MTSTSFTVEVLEDWTSLEGLGADWDALLRQSRADTVFLTWEWIKTWIEVVGSERKPFVVLVRDAAGVLVGAAPFYVAEYRLLKLFTCRVLRVAADWPTGAEYPDWIAHPACEKEVLAAIAGTLRARRSSWDCIWMPNLNGWNGAAERLTTAARESGLSVRSRTTHFGFLTLPSTLQEYESSLSSDRRQQLRRKSRKLLSQPNVAIERCEQEKDIPRFLEALFDLNNRRWSIKGILGTFLRKPAEAEFYRRFAPLALRAGWLRLFAVTDHGEIKAIQFGYCYSGVFMQMQEGFDPEYFAGIGNVLRHSVIGACIDEGIEAYDFLGHMTDHKERWLARKRTGYDIFMGHRSLKSLAVFALRVWPSGRFMQPVQQDVGATNPSTPVAEAEDGV